MITTGHSPYSKRKKINRIFPMLLQAKLIISTFCPLFPLHLLSPPVWCVQFLFSPDVIWFWYRPPCSVQLQALKTLFSEATSAQINSMAGTECYPWLLQSQAVEVLAWLWVKRKSSPLDSAGPWLQTTGQELFTRSCLNTALLLGGVKRA